MLYFQKGLSWHTAQTIGRALRTYLKKGYSPA